MHIELVNDGQNLALIPEIADEAVLADLTALVADALVKAGYQVENNGELDFSEMDKQKSAMLTAAKLAGLL